MTKRIIFALVIILIIIFSAVSVMGSPKEDVTINITSESIDNSPFEYVIIELCDVNGSLIDTDDGNFDLFFQDPNGCTGFICEKEPLKNGKIIMKTSKESYDVNITYNGGMFYKNATLCKYLEKATKPTNYTDDDLTND